VEEHSLAVSWLFLGPCLEVVQSCASQVHLGIIHCFLEERSKLGQLVASIKKAVKEKL
jgi:hypothetical protein